MSDPAAPSLLLPAPPSPALEAKPPPSPAWPAALRTLAATLVVLSVTLGAGLASLHQHRQTELARLQAIALAQAGQLSDWLAERMGDLRFVNGARPWMRLYQGWLRQRDGLQGEALRRQLQAWVQHKNYREALVLDAAGELQLHAGAAAADEEAGASPPVVDTRLRALARELAAEGGLRRLGPYRDDQGQLRLDFAAALPREQGEVGAVVVLRMDESAKPLQALGLWPVPTDSGESVLVARQGERALFLNPLRRDPNAAGLRTRPLGQADALEAQALLQPGRVGQLLQGLDYAGRPSLGVARTVEGSNWLLVAKIDDSEVRAGAIPDLAWVGLAGLLAQVILAGALWQGRQRRELEATRREHSVQEMQLQALRLVQALSDSSTDVIFAKDLEGRYLLFNREACAVTGLNVAQVLGQREDDIFPPEMARLCLESCARVMREQRVITTEELLPTVRGERTFLSTKGPLRDAQGQVIGLYGILRDITDRMLAEQQLRQHEQMLREVSTMARIGGFRIQGGAGQAQQEFWTHEVASLLGLEPGQPVTLARLLSLCPPADRSRLAAAVAAALAQGQSFELEQRLTLPDGRPCCLRIVGLPGQQAPGRDKADDDGLSVLHGFVQDVTEQSRLLEELDQHRNHLEELVNRRTTELADARRRAESASTAKTRFLANMSHEIRTPLHAVIGLTHLLRDGETTALQAARLDKIDAAAYHLLAILNDVLDLSKIEADRVELEAVDFSLGALLDEVRLLVVQPAQARGLALQVAPVEPPLWLRGDATRLRQALLNYAGNAVKFTEQGSVRIAAQVLQQTASRVLLRLAVQDTGIGLSPDQASRVFQAFEQADPSTTRRFGGTGLGLAIVRRLAALMGGETGVDSQAGQGSTFWFTAWFERGLPYALTAAPGQRGEAAQQLRARRSPARVLLAEDNAVNREVMMDLLQAVGLSVDTASDGRQALERALAGGHDLVLMDMQMPVMDGLDTTRALRAEPALARLPIVALTANAFDDDRKACEAAGMNGFIRKPVDPDTLYRCLLQWLPAAPLSPPTRTAPGLQAPPGLQVPGLDVARGLQVCGHDLGLYRRVLAAFQRSHGEDVARLQALQDSADLPGLRLAAHSLKGSAGAIGAQGVAEAARALEQMLRETPPPAPADAALVRALAALQGALAGLLAALAQAQLASEPGADPAGSPVAMQQPTVAQAQFPPLAPRQALAQLREHLATGHLAAGAFAQAHAPALASLLGQERARLLAQHVGRFDYDAAQRLLADADADADAGAGA